MISNKSKNKKSLWHILIYVGVAAFYFFIAFQTPYAHDDWDWGTSFGMNNFLHAVQNSRYVGNFFAIILTRSELLKTLVMGSVFFLIPYTLTVLAEKAVGDSLPVKRHTLFVLCNLIILSVNKSLWSQTYGWVSGFANYTVSALFITFWINEILNATADTQPFKKDSFFVTALCFITALCTQLFLENVAVFCVIVAVALCIAYYKNYKKVPARIIAELIAALIGLLIMFSSSVYATLLQKGTAVNDYRQIPALTGKGASEFVYTTIKTMLHLSIRLYSLNIVLTVSILLIFTALLFKAIRKNKKSALLFIISNLILIVAFISGYIYDQVCTQHLDLIYYCDLLASFLYFSSILIQVIFLFDGKTRRQLISLWVSAPLIIAPLLATIEVGHRLFITPNIFITLFALISFCCLSKALSQKPLKAVQALGVIFTAVLMCVYCVAYVNIGAHKNLRDEIVNEALRNNATAIVLPAYPFDDYLYAPNGGTSYLPTFKEFYSIPEDVEVIFESKQ